MTTTDPAVGPPRPSRRQRPSRSPRTHWSVFAVFLVLLVLALLVSGIADGQVGEGAHAPESRNVAGQVPSAFAAGGPIVDADRPDTAGLSVPDRHVVLTFDDGPTRWTADILDVLQRRGVPATFFVVGARAADRPDLLRRMYQEGHEVGVHTFSHTNLANVSPQRQRIELDQTQLSIAAATGHATSLLRPPYSSQADAVNPSEWRALASARGYRIVYTDLDTRDWARPGVDSIVAAGTPQGDRGAVIMLHDGGGDRSQTVQALDLLITRLQTRGYTFEVATSAVGLSSAWHPATASDQRQGRLVGAAVSGAALAVDLIQFLFILLAVLAVLRILLLVVLARRHDRRAPPPLPVQADLPGVTVIVPAYNEEVGIAATLRSLRASDYPDLEIIVVDDGSTDATAEVVRALELDGVRLICQANAGKPAALNTGLDAASHDLLVLVDGDTVFEPDAIKALVAPFIGPEGARIGAVSGNTKVGNRRGLLGRWQHIEYVIGFNLDRRMFDLLECMPTVPGAIGAFRRHALVRLGGVSEETLAEDTDLTMGICRDGWRVVYAPAARAWTEAPASLGQLWRQRYRWCYGTMQAMWKHRHAVVQSGAAGRLGRRGLPYLLAFQVMLPMLAPIIDIATVYSLVVSPSPKMAYVWLGFLALQMLSAAYAFRLDGEPLGPLWSLPLQQLVYRQVMYLVVIESAASALYGVQLRWQAMRRLGDLDAVPEGIVDHHIEPGLRV